MKRILLVLLLVAFTCSCAPRQANHISDDSLIAMESASAIVDWRKTLDETDECSSTFGCGWFAEFFLEKNWQDCCFQHDFDYREGAKYGITKSQADYALWECVDASGHPFVANLVYDAVWLCGESSYIEAVQLE